MDKINENDRNSDDIIRDATQGDYKYGFVSDILKRRSTYY